MPYLIERVRHLVASAAPFGDEAHFHRAASLVLQPSTSKVLATFSAPRHAPLRPGAADIEACRSRGVTLDRAGRDPCGGRRRQIGLVWEHDGFVAIELKMRERWQSDTYGYDVLKDIHRLERLHTLRARTQGVAVRSDRYVFFLSNVPDYWSVPTREPEAFRLTDGRSITAPYWVQYDQPSPITRWHGYPPFYLAHPYVFKWADVGSGYRCLAMRVVAQHTAPAPGA